MERYIYYLRWFIILAFLTSIHTENLSVLGYFDLVYKDVLEREYPNGYKEDLPGSFNLLRSHLIINSRISPQWKSYSNLRFMQNASLSSDNHNDAGRIELLEAWVEYNHSELLNIKAGKFLAPFGYFNERKFQSPVFNSVVLPAMYEEEFYIHKSAGTIIPPSQNFQIFGNCTIFDQKISYNIYVGNGSSLDEHGLDLNDNKSIGSRIQISPNIFNSTYGVSYHQENGTFEFQPDIDIDSMWTLSDATPMGTDMPPGDVKPILIDGLQQENRSTIGVDGKMNFYDFELRTEFIITRISDLDLKEGNLDDYDDSDFSKTFYYFHTNYKLTDKITPFAEVNFYEDPRHFVFRNQLTRYTFGVSYRPIMNILIKSEIHDHQFGTDFNSSPTNFKSFKMFWLGISVFYN